MLVREQMVLAVFIIALAFRAETELQIIPILLRPPADGAFMFGNALRLAHLLPVNLFPANLMGRNPAVIPGAEKENQEIHDRGYNCHPPCPVADDKHKYHPDRVDNPHPFRFKRNDKIQTEL